MISVVGAQKQQIFSFFEIVTSKIDDGQLIVVIYLDYSKEFDKVQHKRLINELEAHEITGSCLNWIKQWLSNLRQRVVINGQKSKSGVPQRSVLGTLFIIFINDLYDESTLSPVNIK